MAKRYEDECVNCPPELGCLGSDCPKKNVLHFYCDKCDEEAELYHYDGKELCIECIKDMLERVEE